MCIFKILLINLNEKIFVKMSAECMNIFLFYNAILRRWSLTNVGSVVSNFQIFDKAGTEIYAIQCRKKMKLYRCKSVCLLQFELYTVK